MAFIPKDWKDFPDTTTPLTQAAMEDLETRVYDGALFDSNAYTDTEVLDAITTATDDATTYTDAQVDALREEPLPLSTLNTGTPYTLTINDLNTMVRMSSSGAQTVTVPSAVFSAGDRVEISQELGGQTTIEAGSGMSLESGATVPITISYQYGQALLTFWSSTVCRVTGDIS